MSFLTHQKASSNWPQLTFYVNYVIINAVFKELETIFLDFISKLAMLNNILFFNPCFTLFNFLLHPFRDVNINNLLLKESELHDRSS